LGLNGPSELLQKFFEKRSAASDAWWVKKQNPEANAFRDPDLISTLKANGFEVSRGDIVPFLLARPERLD
jgi:hypothetical protein